MKILIVDDLKENRFAIEAILEDLEMEIFHAESGNEALSLMLENDYSLVLMDVQMPEMDGFETATYMKCSERTKNIPIIFVTAINKDEEYIFKGYETGAVDYLFKPLNPDILRSKVNVFIKLDHQNVMLRNMLEDRENFIKELDSKNKKIEKQQQQIMEKKKLEGILEMARTIAHEFSQPLSVMLGYTEMLSYALGTESPEQDKIKKIVENGDKLTKIIRKVQDITDYRLVDYVGESKMIGIDPKSL